LLLRLQAPDVGTRFQLRDVLGVLVALVAAAIGLGCLGDWWLVLLGRALAGLEQHLLLLQDVRDLGRLAGEVKVLVNRLLDGRAAKGIVVEGIVGVVEAVAEAVVRLVKVNAVRASVRALQRWERATYTSSSSPAPPLLSPAKASCWPKPGALDEWPRSRGRLVSKPKKDMVGVYQICCFAGCGDVERE
jgi:hypothetical protein